MLQISARVARRKKNEGISSLTDKFKLSIFVGGVILYVETYKCSIKISYMNLYSMKLPDKTQNIKPVSFYTLILSSIKKILESKSIHNTYQICRNKHIYRNEIVILTKKLL